MVTINVNLNADIHLHDYSSQSEVVKELRKMSVELDNLKAEVARNTTVDQSVITLVNGLAQQLRDMANSATELSQLKSDLVAAASELQASNNAVADVVTANTPAA
jgi:TolA-binding protein